MLCLCTHLQHGIHNIGKEDTIFLVYFDKKYILLDYFQKRIKKDARKILSVMNLKTSLVVIESI